MKINENIKIIGKRVILVPYEAKHVPKYHEWMKSKDLQELTGSEPLTLDEEYNMQKSWRTDEDKLTFLVLDLEKYNSTKDEVESLIGDTNLFLSNIDDSNGLKLAEAEIMIAHEEDRGKGFGPEAMLQMFRYAIDTLQSIHRFEAKIGYSNEKSIQMFNKFGFVEDSRSDVFKEVTLGKTMDDSFKDFLHKNLEFKEEIYWN